MRTCATACLAAVLLWGNVVFWDRLNLPHNGGMRSAVAAILERIRPGESIVATDVDRYVTAKFYVGRRAPIRLIEPPPDLFWGWHLIRPDDVIPIDELRRDMARGVWLIGTIPVPVVSPDWDLGEARLLGKHDFHYDLSLHRNLYVHHYEIPADRPFAGGAGRAEEE